jgi:hypothetical protein
MIHGFGQTEIWTSPFKIFSVVQDEYQNDVASCLINPSQAKLVKWTCLALNVEFFIVKSGGL